MPMRNWISFDYCYRHLKIRRLICAEWGSLYLKAKGTVDVNLLFLWDLDHSDIVHRCTLEESLSASPSPAYP